MLMFCRDGGGARLRAIVSNVPVLLIQGAEDRMAGSPLVGMAIHRHLLAGSPEVTTAVIDRAGHELVAEQVAPVFQATLSAWLGGKGF